MGPSFDFTRVKKVQAIYYGLNNFGHPLRITHRHLDRRIPHPWQKLEACLQSADRAGESFDRRL